MVKEVAHILTELKPCFDLLGNPQINSSWSQYLRRIDHEIEECLRKSLKKTLLTIRSYLTKGIGTPSSGIGSSVAESIVVLEATFSAENERVRKINY